MIDYVSADICILVIYNTGYDTKQSDGEVPVMPELLEMQSTPLLPLLLGSLWPEVVARDRILLIDQSELNCVRMPNRIVWNRTVLYIETAYICRLK